MNKKLDQKLINIEIKKCNKRIVSKIIFCLIKKKEKEKKNHV